MKMDEMNAYFERKGFKVERTYRNGRYEFIISKNGVHHRGMYEWPNDQQIFIDQMITDFEAEFSKYLGEKSIHTFGELDRYARDRCCSLSVSQSFYDEITLEVEHGNDIYTKTFHTNRPEINWLYMAKQMIDDITYEGIKEMRPMTRTYANGQVIPRIKNVIFNDPATIVFWSDGTKTVVKCQDDDWYDPEKGLAMAISKKALGNKGNYCNELKKWLPKEEPIDWCADIFKWGDEVAKGIIAGLCKPITIPELTINNFNNSSKHKDSVQKAYDILIKIAKDSNDNHRDYQVSMDDIDAVIGYLGEALED